jgi:hypothetical protein
MVKREKRERERELKKHAPLIKKLVRKKTDDDMPSRVRIFNLFNPHPPSPLLLGGSSEKDPQNKKRRGERSA